MSEIITWSATGSRPFHPVRCFSRRRVQAAVIGFVLPLVGCTSRKVPPDVHKLVFSEGRFAAPISITLPSDDGDRGTLEIIRSGRYSPATQIRNYGMQNMTDMSLLAFLVARKVASVEVGEMAGVPTSILTDSGWRITENPRYLFLVFSEKLSREPGVVRDQSGGYTVNIAKRALNAITYAKQYQAAPLGVSVKVCALTFSYQLDGTLFGLALPKPFEGKAKAYLNPDDGKWTLESIDLPDRGAEEFLSLVREQYPPFDIRAAPKGPVSSGTRARDSTDAVSGRAGSSTGAPGQTAAFSFVGSFSNAKELRAHFDANAEPRIPYSVSLWRDAAVGIVGHVYYLVGEADNPAGKIETGRYDAPSGGLIFRARLWAGESAPGVAAHIVHEFEGHLSDDRLVGSFRRHDERGISQPAEQVVLQKEPSDSYLAGFRDLASWQEEYSIPILKRLGPR